MAQPQRNAGMLRRLRGGLAQRLRGLHVPTRQPVAAAEPREGFGMAGAEIQRALGGALPCLGVAVVELGIGQHHPRDEVLRGSLHPLPQLRAFVARAFSGHRDFRGPCRRCYMQRERSRRSCMQP